MPQVPRFLVYKMTHLGDPDPDSGIWGRRGSDCMGRVRSFPFDVVIGVGGCGSEARRNGIAGRIVWVARGPKRIGHTGRGPTLSFKEMAYFGQDGPLLSEMAPGLAAGLRRFRLNHSDAQHKEALGLLSLLNQKPSRTKDEDEVDRPGQARGCGRKHGVPTPKKKSCGKRKRPGC